MEKARSLISYSSRAMYGGLFFYEDKDALQEELYAERLNTYKTGLRMSESVRFHQTYRIEMGFRKEVHSELRSSFSRRDMTLFSMRKIDFLRSYS